MSDNKHLVINGVHIAGLCTHPDCERLEQIRAHMQDEDTKHEGGLHYLMAQSSPDSDDEWGWRDDDRRDDYEWPEYNDEVEDDDHQS